MAAGRIESSDLSIADVFRDFYLVPDFQREFVWQPENVEQLLQDTSDVLLTEDQSPNEDHEYFIGSVVVCPQDDGRFQVIDGQQRLTTCYLVECVVRDLITESGEQPPTSLAQLIAASMMGPDGNDVNRYRLELQYEDSRGVLEKIGDLGDTHIDEIEPVTTSVKNLINAYRTIREFMVAKFGGDIQQVKSFNSAFVSKVKLIRVVTPDLSMALKVFETINDRGVGLNAMDLLKNLLFMNANDEDFDELKTSWKALSDLLDSMREKPLRFMRYFVLANFETKPSKPIKEDELYDWLSRNEQETQVASDPLGFVDLLLENARAYSNFIKGNDPTGKPNRYLLNLLAANGQQRQHFILLLAGRHLGTNDFDFLAKKTEELMFVLNITRTRANYFESRVGTWAKRLRNAQSRVQLEEEFVPLMSEEMRLRSESFDMEMRHMGIGAVQQYRLRYIIAKLAQYLNQMAFDNKEDQWLSTYLDRSNHIEHILPENPSAEVRQSFDDPDNYDEWKRRLGNLTLLESTINTSIGNSGFAGKREGYRNSQFVLTKTVFEKPSFGTNTRLHKASNKLPHSDVWTAKAIENRQIALSKLAREVWGLDR